jgi:large subunit ribosomal protein L9
MLCSVSFPFSVAIQAACKKKLMVFRSKKKKKKKKKKETFVMFLRRLFVAEQYSSNALYSRQYRCRQMSQKRIPVVMRQTVSGVAFEGELIDVKPGYARNFLLPKGYAVLATDENKRRYIGDAGSQRAALEQAKEERQTQKRLGRLVVTMKRHMMDNGVMHAPVSAKNIVEKLKKQHRIDLEPEQLSFESGAAIEKYGAHKVKAVINGVSCELTLQVDRR